MWIAGICSLHRDSGKSHRWLRTAPHKVSDYRIDRIFSLFWTTHAAKTPQLEQEVALDNAGQYHFWQPYRSHHWSKSCRFKCQASLYSFLSLRSKRHGFATGTSSDTLHGTWPGPTKGYPGQPCWSSSWPYPYGSSTYAFRKKLEWSELRSIPRPNSSIGHRWSWTKCPMGSENHRSIYFWWFLPLISVPPSSSR